MDINELRDKEAQLITRQDEILKRAHDDGNPALTGEELEEFDRIEDELTKVTQSREAAEKHEQRQAALAARITEPLKPEATTSDDQAEREEAEKQIFTKYLREGAQALSHEERIALAPRAVLANGDMAKGTLEQRAQTVTTTGGGYLIPQGFMRELIQAQKAYGAVRSVARVLNTPDGADIPWPRTDDTGNTGELLAINTQAANQDITFGVLTLKAYKYSSKMVLVPIELAQDAYFDLDGYLREILATRIGRITNTHFTTGDNSGKPQGVVNGAGTGATAASASAIGVDDLIELEHTIDPAYRNSGDSVWMFADGTLKALKKLKDANGLPLWLSDFSSPAGASIMGYRYVINQDMTAVGTGVKSVLFGDFSSYIIRDVMDVSLVVFKERYMDYAQVGYLSFSRTDGRYVFAEATNSRVKALLHP